MVEARETRGDAEDEGLTARVDGDESGLNRSRRREGRLERRIVAYRGQGAMLA
jgi:hypothetical protein